jgi:hypothetical protein
MTNESQNPPTSQSLSDASISSAASHGAVISEVERRRFPRVSLSTEQFKLASTGKIFGVCDLSTTGLALRLLDLEDMMEFPVGRTLEGILNMKGTKVPVTLEVRNIRADTVGCAFLELTDGTVQSLERFLDPKRLGRELHPIPSPEGRALWYHGPSGTDLLLWRTGDGAWKRFCLFVYQSYIQWDFETGITTGWLAMADQDSPVEGVVRLETRLLEREGRVDHLKVDVARSLIAEAPLDEELKAFCIRQLRLEA